MAPTCALIADKNREANGCIPTEAVLRTLTYADLFDYPLTVEEIAHYLIECDLTPDQVEGALLGAGAAVEQTDGFYYLRGHGAVVGLRRGRAATAAKLWGRARLYTQLLRRFPYVRMLAVSGALAMDNASEPADIDLLVIAEPGRVWICRRALVLAVRCIRLLGDELCPNFILASDSLALIQQDLFTAHELAQMRPMSGYRVYRQTLAQNPWMRSYLPNAVPWPAPNEGRSLLHNPIQRVAELLLSRRIFAGWERWEMERMSRKLGQDRATGDEEICCTPSQCKGHTAGYRRNVLARYAERNVEF
ncbi:MAG: hypothetical protein ACR2M0_16515 [Chloroflexia bacterium]